MSYPWSALRLAQARAAAQSGCDCAGCVDVISLTAEVERLRAVISDALADLERRDEVSATDRLRAELKTD